MKKRFCVFITIIVVFIQCSIPTMALTKTVPTVSFTAYQMGYYNTDNKFWHIALPAVTDNTVDEYLCAMDQYGLQPNEKYAAIKAYVMQTDADFYCEGNISLVLNDNFAAAKDATVDFMICTNKGRIIYPTNGDFWHTVSLESGSKSFAVGLSGLKENDTVYFIAKTSSSIRSPYLQMEMSVWETPYGAQREGSFTDTNKYKGIQGEDGWYFLCAPISGFTLATREVKLTEKEAAAYGPSTPTGDPTVVKASDNDGDYIEADSEIVISDGTVTTPAATVKAAEKFKNIKLAVTGVIAAAALVLITQGVIFYLIYKKKQQKSFK